MRGWRNTAWIVALGLRVGFWGWWDLEVCVFAGGRGFLISLCLGLYCGGLIAVEFVWFGEFGA